MSIRTTVTLDEDVVERLRHESTARAMPFRELLNSVLRAGLTVLQRSAPDAPFAIEARHMGRTSIPLDNIGAALEAAEGEDYR